MNDTGAEALNLMTQVNNIGFTTFTSGLVSSVFQTVLDVTLQQLTAYGELVTTVSQGLSAYIANSAPAPADVLSYETNVLALTQPSGAADFVVTSTQYDTMKAEFGDISVNYTGSNSTTDKTFTDFSPAGSSSSTV
jgi:hypothetical protein